MSNVRVWDGKEWERHCIALLRLHHGAHELNEVPDRHGGDLGLEAFTHGGCAYQCYAALEPLSTADLYNAQRQKLTDDLHKLRSRSVEVTKLLGGVRIQRYAFMIHRHDSYKLVAHGKTKAAEVRGWNLSFIADDFEIVVLTDDAFAKERADLLALPRPLLDLGPGEAGEDVKAWSNANDALLSTIHRKLSAILQSDQAKQKYSEKLVETYLEGENALTRIRDRYPDQWEVAASCRSNKESLLVLEYASSLETPSAAHIAKIADDLIAELRLAIPSLSGSLAKTIAWTSVADWLMRCPLEFFGTETAA